MTELAPVYLDDARIRLNGEARPQVRAIVAAGGRGVGNVRVVRLDEQGDEDGAPVALDEVIDRAATLRPVYLRCVEGREETQASFQDDESSGLGAGREQFGAARTGLAGEGAKGTPGALPTDKQAKSDFVPPTVGTDPPAPSAWKGDPEDARTAGYEDGQSTARHRRPPPGKGKDGPATSTSADAD